MEMGGGDGYRTVDMLCTTVLSETARMACMGFWLIYHDFKNK